MRFTTPRSVPFLVPTYEELQTQIYDALDAVLQNPDLSEAQLTARTNDALADLQRNGFFKVYDFRVALNYNRYPLDVYQIEIKAPNPNGSRAHSFKFAFPTNQTLSPTDPEADFFGVNWELEAV